MQPSASGGRQQPARLPQRKVFDVMRPGRTPADPTSKPVIARPQVQDPNITVNGIGESRKIEVFSGAHRQPPIEVPNDEQQEAQLESAEAAVANARPEPAHPLDASPDLLPSQPQPEVPAPVESGSAGDPLLQTPEEDLSDVAASMRSESGYSVPVSPAGMPPGSTEGQGVVVSDHPPHSGSRAKVIVLLVVILLLGLAIFDILLDAGFFVLNGVPHTTFFTE